MRRKALNLASSDYALSCHLLILLATSHNFRFTIIYFLWEYYLYIFTIYIFCYGDTARTERLHEALNVWLTFRLIESNSIHYKILYIYLLCSLWYSLIFIYLMLIVLLNINKSLINLLRLYDFALIDLKIRLISEMISRGMSGFVNLLYCICLVFLLPFHKFCLYYKHKGVRDCKSNVFVISHTWVYF